MNSATNACELAVLRHFLGIEAQPFVPAMFIGAFTAAPGETGGGVEVVGNGYARVQAAFAVDAGTSVAANAATLEFPTATNPWGEIGWLGAFTAAAGGTLLFYSLMVDPADFTTPLPKNIGKGDILRIPAGYFSVGAD